MKNKAFSVERLSYVLTQKIGTPISLVIHTIFFIGMFLLPLFGVEFQQMLLILTTIVSLEAIYLALFIQMTVNKASESIENVAEDIEEVAGDVEDIEEDIDEIQESDKEDDLHEEKVTASLTSIETQLKNIQKDLRILKEKGLLE